MKAGLQWWQRQMRPTTFRARITLVMTLLALTILALVDVIVYVGRRGMFQNNLDAALMSIAHAEAASALGTIGDILPAPDGGLLVFPMPAASTLETYACIADGHNRVLAHTANVPRPLLAALGKVKTGTTPDGGIRIANVMVGSQPMRCLSYPFVNSHRMRLMAIVAVSEEPMVSSLRSLTALLCGSLAFGGLVFAVASSRLSLRLTRPLSRIAGVAREVGETNLHARIPEVSPDAELHDVVEVLNDMLQRLETAFTQQQALMAEQKTLVAEQQALVTAQQRFVADASHELRSPLSNLRGTVEVALRRPRAPEDYRETLAVALSEIQRLSRLVEDLLTLSRADTGHFPLNRQPCDLGDIARASAHAHAARAEQSGVAFHISTPEPAPVSGDPDRLRQVVDNLLDNALKYAPSKTTVDITVQFIGQEIRLMVSDNGPGIPPADAARVFYRFYRTDLSRTRASGGAGLGLAIAQAIMRAHGGKIAVESEPGMGTTFILSLPAALQATTHQPAIP